MIVKRDAGLTIKAEFRVGADPELQTDEKQTPPEAPPVPERNGANVVARLNAMTADIKTALAGPNKARVQALFVAVSGQIKSKDFAAAGKGLDELQPLLKSLADSRGTPAPPDGAAVVKRLNALTADIKTALSGPNKARVQTLFVAINGHVKNHEFVEATKALDELEPLLKQSAGGGATGGGAGGGAGAAAALEGLAGCPSGRRRQARRDRREGEGRQTSEIGHRLHEAQGGGRESADRPHAGP